MKPVVPLEWQTAPIASLTAQVRDGGSALDASDTGTGKTIVALFVALELGLSVAVVCPKSVIPAWREACSRVGVHAEFIQNVEALKVGSAYLTRKGKNWFWALPQGVLLVFDEVHRFGAPNTQNARILAAAPKPVLMLSATAAADPTKMRAIGHQLGLCRWSDWWSWCGSHGCRRGRFGGLKFVGTPERLRELHRQIFDAGLGVRVRIADLPPGTFPSNQIETVLVPVVDQRAIDDAYRAELEAKKDNAPAAITELLRARQIVEHEKLPAIVELVEDLIESGTSVAVFVNFRESLDQLQHKFSAAVIHGDQTAQEREQQIRAFQDDGVHVVVSMIQAGGVGISLHDLHGARPRVSIVCPGWSAVELRQALGRIHRAGAKSPALQKIIFAEGTVDERIRAKVDAKLANLDALNDGDLSAATADNETTDTMKNATTRQTTSDSPVPAVQDPAAGGQNDMRLVRHGNRKHSKISPSKLKLLEISPRFIEDPTRAIHPITEEGTLCHEALDSGDDSKLSPDQQRWVAMCRDHIRPILPGGTEFREQRLEIMDGVWGFADLILLAADRRTAALVDYKFGANAQEDVETNPAAQAYAFGVMKRWPQVGSVDVHYLYPRLEEISMGTYTRADMDRIELRISTICARVEQAMGCTATTDTCTYCGRKASCADLHALVLPIATRYGAKKGLAVPPEYDPSLITDPVTMAKALTVAHVMEEWADSVKVHALKLRHECGQEIPGFDYRSRQGRKRIVNPQLAYELAMKGGITHEQFLRAVDVSAKGLSDAAGENAPKGQKTKAAQAIEDTLRETGALEVGADVFYLTRARQ